MEVTFTTIIHLLHSFYKSNQINSDINLVKLDGWYNSALEYNM